MLSFTTRDCDEGNCGQSSEQPAGGNDGCRPYQAEVMHGNL